MAQVSYSCRYSILLNLLLKDWKIRNINMESLNSFNLPSILMVLFFIGIVITIWLALDPIRQKYRKPKYFLLTLLFFAGFILVAWWDL